MKMLIILFVIVERRDKNGNNKQNTDDKGKANGENIKTTSTGAAPINRDSRPNRPGTQNGPNPVNPNPNPAYTTPVYPQQVQPVARTGSDSPAGFGDIGARPVKVGGSNPHLDESLDQSFEHGNYPHKMAPGGGSSMV